MKKFLEFTDNSKNNEGRISPGLIKKHYAPKVPLKINMLKSSKNEIFIGFGPKYGEPNLSKTGNLNEAAANLFFLPREV